MKKILSLGVISALMGAGSTWEIQQPPSTRMVPRKTGTSKHYPSRNPLHRDYPTYPDIFDLSRKQSAVERRAKRGAKYQRDYNKCVANNNCN